VKKNQLNRLEFFKNRLVRFFLKKNSLVTFFDKNQTENDQPYNIL
jgi:hypothetical protein